MPEKEIWVVSGRHPVLWTIPFEVWYPTPDKPEMMPAIHLLPMQLEAVANRLATFAERDAIKCEIFRTTAKQLQQVAVQSVGNALIDHLFSWGPRPAHRFTEEEQKWREEREEFDAFLDALYLEGGIGESRAQLEFMWVQFCKHAQNWLVNHERPVDMLFIKLHPTPFRANWLQIVLTRVPKAWRTQVARTKFKEEYVVDQEEFLTHLLSPDLLAINRQGQYCYKRVEVEHCKPWWRSTQKVEKARMGVAGVYGYAASVFDHVKRFLPAAIRIYGAFIAQISRPCPRVVPRLEVGDYRFLPGRAVNAIQRDWRRTPLFQPPVVLARLSRPTPSREPRYLPEKNVSLPAMPAVQPLLEDVRDGGGEVSGPGYDADGKPRLPVLPADEKLADG